MVEYLTTSLPRENTARLRSVQGRGAGAWIQLVPFSSQYTCNPKNIESGLS